MKRYSILILAFLVLGSGVMAGCSQKPEQVQELSSGGALTPKVIEKDVEVNAGIFEVEYLPFYLKVGDRVEGEVSVSHTKGMFGGSAVMVGQVRDPYSNVVVQSSHLTFRSEYWEKLGFPWRFAFIAYTDGEYRLSVFHYPNVFEAARQNPPSAHLKITVYESD